MQRIQSVFVIAVGCAIGLAATGFGGVRVESAALEPNGARRAGEDLAARARLANLRARFPARRASPTLVAESARHPSSVRQPTIGAGRVSSFEISADAFLGTTIDKRGFTASATVSLPVSARGGVGVRDDTSHIAIRFSLRDARDVPAAISDGIVLYAGASGGNDVVHRIRADGTEDFVVFESKPLHEELAYDVDVSLVAGLRLVSDTLEFLDEGGAPRLRIAPPTVVDRFGETYPAHIAIEGCAYDASPRAPWRRAVVNPGAARCEVRVSWGGIRYPAIVDPSWVATGSMVSARTDHTANVLPSGSVLIVGGQYDNGSLVSLASAELYDPASATFAATGAMGAARAYHTANVLGTGAVLVAGGTPDYDTTELITAELYDPSTGTFSATGAMAYARDKHTATNLASGKVLIVGGRSNMYDLVNGEIYDPSTGTFSESGVMPRGQWSHTASLLASGEVLITGGVPGDPSGQLYDPSTGQFSTTGSMVTSRFAHRATVLQSGEVLITGGTLDGSTFLASAEIYDPVAGTFASLGDMSAARCYHTATLLASGQVLVAGGWNLSTSEVYDPMSATFRPTASMAADRGGHAAALLPSGDVLVAGGYQPNFGIFGETNVEIYEMTEPGAACASANDCGSGICRENCCTEPCTGTCMTCAVGTGSCTATTSAPDPESCTGTMSCDATGECIPNGTCGTDADCSPRQYCDATGMCTPNTTCATDAECSTSQYCDATGTCRQQKPNAAACNPAADCKAPATCLECAGGMTGNCVDGVCCTSTCADQCGACNVPGFVGRCAAVTGAPQGGRPPCVGGAAPCAATCDGTTLSACTFPGQSVSCSPTCAGGVEQPEFCNGAGGCRSNVSILCAPFACNATTGECNTVCAGDADCASGLTCTNGECEVPTATPCDASSACASAPSSSGDSGGCSVTAATTRGSLPAGGFAAGVGLGLLALLRRRRGG